MNPFTDHPQQQGVNYRTHMQFAMGIALRLFNSVIAFTLHAVFPFIGIKPTLDLEATVAYLRARNDWIEATKRETAADPAPGRRPQRSATVFAARD